MKLLQPKLVRDPVTHAKGGVAEPSPPRDRSDSRSPDLPDRSPPPLSPIPPTLPLGSSIPPFPPALPRQPGLHVPVSSLTPWLPLHDPPDPWHVQGVPGLGRCRLSNDTPGVLSVGICYIWVQRCPLRSSALDSRCRVPSHALGWGEPQPLSKTCRGDPGVLGAAGVAVAPTRHQFSAQSTCATCTCGATGWPGW